MELNTYQNKALETCLDSSFNLDYMLLNLTGEVGEFASKIAKAIRKEEIEPNSTELPEELEKELKKEAGDILWQLAGLCSVFYWELNDIAGLNLEKLAQRRKNNTIEGEGDNR